MHTGDAAAFAGFTPERECRDVVVGGKVGTAPEPPGGFLAQDPRRLAPRVALDDAAFDVEIAPARTRARPS